MKILYLTDTQIRGKNPRNRIDNYYDSLMEKLNECLQIAKKNKVEMIIHGGDFLDTDLVSTIICDEVMDLIESYKIPFYIAPGNHDETNNNWKLSKASTLAHIFRRSKIIKILDVLDYTDTNDNFFIRGQEYFVGIEEWINENGVDITVENDACTIYVPHAMIVDVEVPWTSCIPYTRMKTNYDIVLVSHNHKFWGIEEHNGTKFIAPGAIARVYADKFDMDRIPSVAIIDTKTKDVELIELKTAKPIEQIFDLKKLKEIKENCTKLESFVNGLKDAKIQTLNLIDVVLSICEQSKVTKPVIKNLRERISLNEKEIS